MRLFKLAYKNITVNKGRTMVLGSFILVTTLLLVMSNALILTAQGNMQQAIRQALSGEIQIRSVESLEDDLFPMDGGWDEVISMNKEEIKWLEEILDYQVKIECYTPSIRGGGKIVSEEKEITSMLMGIDLETKVYQKSLALREGRYAEKAYEIVLSADQAKKLEVSTGDWVTIIISDAEDDLQSEQLKVVGIGDIQILSHFGFETIYMDFDKMHQLSGLGNQGATDMFIYCPVSQVSQIEKQLTNILMNNEETLDHYKITTWKDMGGFVNAIMTMIIAMLYVFIGIFIVIIGVLILNMMTMVAVERRQEIGVLRAIGYSKRQVLWIFMSEILGITVLAATMGCLLGIGITAYLSKKTFTVAPPMDYMFGQNFTMAYEPIWCIPVWIMMLIFIGITAFKPCVRAIKERPVEILGG